MKVESLTYESVRVRAVLVPLKRKVVSRVGFFDRWPLILIDLQTKEGIVGRSYLEPYLQASPRYIMPAISDLVEARKGKPLAPMADFQAGRKSLNLIGYEGVAMIANAGIDMAGWDALAKAADVPLAVLLGGTVGSVPAYNSNGLWLTDPDSLHDEAAELAAEGGFDAFKLRLGRDQLEDDLRAISQVRAAVGSNAKLMVDFNQGLTLGDAIRRCHALDELGLYWFEEPTTYNNLEGYAQLAAELRTPLQLGENFYGPRELYRAISMRAGDYVMPDMMRIGGVSGWLRSVPIAAAAGIEVSTHLYPEVSAHLMRVTETAHWLEWQDWADPILKEPFPVVAGQLQIPHRAGIGIEWDEDAVRRFAA
ncbi:enolase C-terminal domain-like protein [Piscinibacter sp.]|uniref:enolase C-terminal domain-like protein n=1 Tax=Piscinibacter sp. TaxID=1903157 RepID=UPI001D4A102C|nr:enolase C-terminal domain-like protein [Piscinibacter sp.]MBK7529744.1 mandelate racemase [Piscinibacter sp.]